MAYNQHQNITKSNTLKTKRAKHTSMTAGIRMQEGISTFTLSYQTYDAITGGRLVNESSEYIIGNMTTATKESRFINDAISDRVMEVDFQGVFDDIALKFENPILVSQRKSENEQTIEDLIDP